MAPFWNIVATTTGGGFVLDEIGPLLRAISGKTFVFDDNPLGIRTMVLTFDRSAEAFVRRTLAQEDPGRPWPAWMACIGCRRTTTASRWASEVTG